MPEYPLDAPRRAAERTRIRAQVLVDAERKAAATGRSLRCSGYHGEPERHAGMEGGCRNSGTNCICECHDPQTPPPDPPAG